jgi:hypothetical protein
MTPQQKVAMLDLITELQEFKAAGMAQFQLLGTALQGMPETKPGVGLGEIAVAVIKRLTEEVEAAKALEPKMEGAVAVANGRMHDVAAQV